MKSIIAFSILLFSSYLQAQTTPKLVVGIVVDQMRYDFLYRYYEKYGSNGFKKLMNKGVNCSNTYYNYFPTYTGPGHASIYTGTTPGVHGIVANDWYETAINRGMYVTEDTNVVGVGTTTKEGKMSPANLLTTTITDQLKLSNQQQSKVIGISLKDRGAILPAGHLANAAYWYDGETGKWITSSYYMNKLPNWVEDFNAKNYSQQYINKGWNTLYPINTYTESTSDNQGYEKAFDKTGTPTFPYELTKYTTGKKPFDIVRRTPFGNTLTKDLAKEAIKNEQLGKGKFTDFLAISFSSTDYVGHQFGPHSIETEDTYLRLDADIADFITYLEKQMPSKDFLIFLTADHGVVENPEHLQQLKIPAGYFDFEGAIKRVEHTLDSMYGNKEWILEEMNQQIYLNPIAQTKEIQEVIAKSLLKEKGAAAVYGDLLGNGHHITDNEYIKNGHWYKRCGNMYVQFEPGWFEKYDKMCTTHGSYYEYDTHVPLLWYGNGLKPSRIYDKVYITDITPTIAQFMNLLAPNGCTGKPIVPILKR